MGRRELRLAWLPSQAGQRCAPGDPEAHDHSVVEEGDPRLKADRHRADGVALGPDAPRPLRAARRTFIQAARDRCPVRARQRRRAALRRLSNRIETCEGVVWRAGQERMPVWRDSPQEPQARRLSRRMPGAEFGVHRQPRRRNRRSRSGRRGCETVSRRARRRADEGN